MQNKPKSTKKIRHPKVSEARKTYFQQIKQIREDFNINHKDAQQHYRETKKPVETEKIKIPIKYRDFIKKQKKPIQESVKLWRQLKKQYEPLSPFYNLINNELIQMKKSDMMNIEQNLNMFLYQNEKDGSDITYFINREELKHTINNNKLIIDNYNIENIINDRSFVPSGDFLMKFLNFIAEENLNSNIFIKNCLISINIENDQKTYKYPVEILLSRYGEEALNKFSNDIYTTEFSPDSANLNYIHVLVRTKRIVYEKLNDSEYKEILNRYKQRKGGFFPYVIDEKYETNAQELLNELKPAQIYNAKDAIKELQSKKIKPCFINALEQTLEQLLKENEQNPNLVYKKYGLCNEIIQSIYESSYEKLNSLNFEIKNIREFAKNMRLNIFLNVIDVEKETNNIKNKQISKFYEGQQRETLILNYIRFLNPNDPLNNEGHFYPNYNINCTLKAIQLLKEIKGPLPTRWREIYSMQTAFKKAGQNGQNEQKYYKYKSGAQISINECVIALIKNNLLRPLTNDEKLHKREYFIKSNKNKTLTNEDLPNKYISLKKKQINYNKSSHSFDFIIYADFESDTTTNKDKHLPIAFNFQTCEKQNATKHYNEYYDTMDFYSKSNPETASERLIEKFIDLILSYFIFNNKKDKSIMYFHNAKYDLVMFKNMILKNQYIKSSKIIENSGVFYELNLTFKNGAKFIIRDTYKFLSQPLATLSKAYKIDNDKEIIPYKLLTTENFKKGLTIEQIQNYEEWRKEPHLKDEFIKRLLEQAEKNGGLKEGKALFDIRAYTKYYCIKDVTILKTVFNKFIDGCEKLNLNVLENKTASSMAHNYMINKNVYEDVEKISGTYRDYIYQAIMGGRVMTRNNEKAIVTKTKDFYSEEERNHIIKLNGGEKDAFLIQNIDVVSLYPAAMSDLATKLGGLLKGEPKKFNGDEFQDRLFLKSEAPLEENEGFSNRYLIKGEKVSGFFATINIEDMQEKHKFKGFSIINEKNKTRKWTDNNEDFYKIVDGEKIYNNYTVDMITYEDLINFHKTKLIVKGGIYFNEGRNSKIGEIINELFESRKDYKNGNKEKEIEKNDVAQNVIKLLMNSSYGKTLEEVHAEQNKIVVGEEEIKKFWLKNINLIIESEQTDIQNTKIETFKLSTRNKYYETGRYCQVGTEILSMSKRIMNKILLDSYILYGIDENGNYIDNYGNIENYIYYTDTDSIHLLKCCIKIIQERYMKKYGINIIDKNKLGHYHEDFADTSKYNDEIDRVIKNIDGIEAIYIDKKLYTEKCGGKKLNNEDGKFTNIKSKGVNESNFTHLTTEGGYRYAILDNQGNKILRTKFNEPYFGDEKTLKGDNANFARFAQNSEELQQYELVKNMKKIKTSEEHIIYENEYQIYEDLAKGYIIQFDLTNGKTKPKFKYGKGNIFNDDSIYRCLSANYLIHLTFKKVNKR